MNILAPKKYKISIFGSSYTLVSDDSPELLQAAAKIVDAMMRDIAKGSQISDPKSIAILVALNIATKNITLEENSQENEFNHKELFHRIEKQISSLLN